jgi:hypothetical protein
VLSECLIQEEFESLKEVASAALGDAQNKNHQTEVSQTTTMTSKKLASLAPSANTSTANGDGWTEVHSGVEYVSAFSQS